MSMTVYIILTLNVLISSMAVYIILTLYVLISSMAVYIILYNNNNNLLW